MLKTLNLQKLGTFCLRPVHAFLDLVPVDLAEDRVRYVSVPNLLVVYKHKHTNRHTHAQRNTRTNAHTHTHTRTHTHTHTHTQKKM